jgi:hypothetical protein
MLTNKKGLEMTELEQIKADNEAFIQATWARKIARKQREAAKAGA